ncbi:MAG: hypothetical protein HY400_00835 [Elusimicrobia bacterium]|nr:hypothetical protein [Elusimicrobiota bacterium]
MPKEKGVPRAHKLLFFLALSSTLFFSPLIQAETIEKVVWGPIQAFVSVSGRMEAVDPWDVDAPMDGRMESLRVLPLQWIRRTESLALLVSPEMALLLDSARTTSSEMMENRWKDIYKPKPLFPTLDGFIIRVNAEPKKNFKRGDVLFHMARYLAVTSPVGPGEEKWLREGLPATLWLKKSPLRKTQATVLKVFKESRKGPTWVQVAVTPQSDGLSPGEAIEGKILVAEKENTLLVPKKALRFKENRAFLMLEVKPGIPGEAMVEILSGAEEGKRFLILDP